MSGEIDGGRRRGLRGSRYALTGFTFSKQQTVLVIKTNDEEGASPDLRRGRTGADPGVDDEADREGWTEKSDTASVSLISLRTLLAR